MDKIKPHSFFLVIGLLLGLMYFLFTPPFQSPDEFNHFYRAYRISEGDFLPVRQGQRLGGKLPESFLEFITPYDEISVESKNKITKHEILQGFDIEFKSEETDFVDFPNTSYYSVISYLPQVSAIFICKHLNTSVGTMYYSAKLFTFLIWLLIVFYCIKIIPVGKWMLFCVSLLPMQLYISSSLSADTVTNQLCFLIIAFVIRLAIESDSVQNKDVLILIILSSLLALAKVVYFPIVLIVLIIPKYKYKSKLYFYFSLVLIIIFSGISAICWTDIVTKNFISYSDYDVYYRWKATLGIEENYSLQKSHLYKNPLKSLLVVYKTLVHNPEFYIKGYIANFGRYCGLILPNWTYFVAYFAIIIATFIDGLNKTYISFKRLMFILTAIILLALLILSQYLTWAKLDAEFVDAIQGRYLVPILPLLLFGIGHNKLKLFTYLPMFCFACILAINFSSINCLNQRFFEENYKNKSDLFFDFEYTGEVKYNQLRLNTKACFTSTESYNGLRSLDLSKDSSEVIICNFENFNEGDLLKVEAWRKGWGGRIGFYATSMDTVITLKEDENQKFFGGNGWYKMSMIFIMDKTIENANFSVKLSKRLGNSIYFDDVRVTVKRY